MASPLKIYEIEDSQTGQVYKIEGPADAAPEEVYAFLEQSLSSSAPPESVTPSVSVDPVSAPVQSELPMPAPQPAPAQAPRQGIENVVINAAGGGGDPRFLGDQEQAYVQLARDPNVSYEQVNEFVKQQAAAQGLPVQDTMVNPYDLAEFRKQLAANPDAPIGAVTYQDWKDALPTPGHTLSEKDGFFTDILRSVQQAGQEMGLGVISRYLNDWMDTGGDIIDAKFPDATPEQRERLQEEYVSWLQRKVREANEAEVKDDGIVPWIIGQIITPDPVDVIPFGKAARGATAGARIGQKIGEGAAINAVADAGYQGLDMYDDVQDEFSLARMGASAAFGGALHGGVQGLGEAVGRATRGAPAPVPESIALPTAKKGSKQYKQELGTVQDKAVDYVNTITEGWTNAPKVTVHDRFTKVKGVDNDAVAVYDSRTGEVKLNTEAAVREAQRLDTSVEDVLNAAVFHESLGHYGLAQRFGDDLEATMAQFVADGDANIQRRLADWLEKNPDAYEGAPNRDLLAMEEMLAEWSESGPITNTLYDTIANMVKNFGRQMGLDLQFSRREIRAILAQAHGKVIKGDPVEVGGSGVKYMRPTRTSSDLRGVSRDDLSADELFEVENAYDVLQNLTKDYEPTVMDFDTLKAEAEARGLTPSRLLRNKQIAPGDLARRFLMQDIAADKLNQRVTELYSKIENGTATYQDRVNHATALLKFQELSDRIFDEHGEAGRLLRTIQELQYTRRKMTSMRDALEDFTAKGLAEILDDPVAYQKYAQQIQEQLKEAKDTGSNVASVLNIPRAIMSSFDVSAPFRQGLFLVRRPQFWKSLPSMFRVLASKENYDDLMADITSRNTYPLMVESGLQLSSNQGKLTAREEDFQTDLVQKVPVLGAGVKASERAYTGFLNKLRADVFDQMIADAERAGVQLTDDLYKQIARHINNASGRGSFGEGKVGQAIQSASPLLNAVFFSPKLIASRFQLLNPWYYVKLDPFVRKEALKDLAATAGFVSSVVGLAALAGADVETDPRSSDFMKIKSGNTRWDVGGGFLQYLTLYSRALAKAYNAFQDPENKTHEYKTSMGEGRRYGSGFGQRSLWNAVEDFLYNKFSPIASFTKEAIDGTTATGDPFTLTGTPENDYLDSAVVSRMIPMFIQDLIEVAQEHGIVGGSLRAAPGLIGASVQNYTPAALDTTKKIEAPETFKMSDLEDGENDQIRVKDGEVLLKKEVREVWQNRLDEVLTAWMNEETSSPEWETMTDKEKAEVIDEVRQEARKVVKEEMLEYLQLN